MLLTPLKRRRHTRQVLALFFILFLIFLASDGRHYEDITVEEDAGHNKDEARNLKVRMSHSCCKLITMNYLQS